MKREDLSRARPALMVAIALALIGCGCGSTAARPQERANGAGRQTLKNVHDFVVTSMDGQDVRLADYDGKVLLLVNVASKCGFTGQYADLQKLYETHKESGFAVLGFPANNFLGQEPGSNEEIREFCTLNYGVTFPVFAKISVKGKDQHPLYEFLTNKKTNPEFGGSITWNFNKFLVDRQGRVVGRFGSRDKPMGKAIVNAVEAALTRHHEASAAGSTRTMPR